MGGHAVENRSHRTTTSDSGTTLWKTWCSWVRRKSLLPLAYPPCGGRHQRRPRSRYRSAPITDPRVHEAGNRVHVPSLVVFQTLDEGTRAVANTGKGHSDSCHTTHLLISCPQNSDADTQRSTCHSRTNASAFSETQLVYADTAARSVDFRLKTAVTRDHASSLCGRIVLLPRGSSKKPAHSTR